MADTKSTAPEGAAAQDCRVKDFQFKPFTFGREEFDCASLPGGNVQRFANLVESLSHGSSLILNLIEWDLSRADDHETDPDEPAPLFNDFHRGVLMRLVATHMEVLSRESEDIKSWAFDQHTEAGRAEQLAAAKRMVALREVSKTAKG